MYKVKGIIIVMVAVAAYFTILLSQVQGHGQGFDTYDRQHFVETRSQDMPILLGPELTLVAVEYEEPKTYVRHIRVETWDLTHAIMKIPQREMDAVAKESVMQENYPILLAYDFEAIKFVMYNPAGDLIFKTQAEIQ